MSEKKPKIIEKSPPSSNIKISNKIHLSNMKEPDKNKKIEPKFGIKPSNQKIMFLKHELNNKELLDEKIKQTQLKEFLEFLYSFIKIFIYPNFLSFQIYQKTKNNIFSSPQLGKSGKFKINDISPERSFIEGPSAHDISFMNALNDSNHFKVLKIKKL